MTRTAVFLMAWFFFAGMIVGQFLMWMALWPQIEAAVIR